MLISLTVRHLAGREGTGTYSYEFDRDEVLVGRDPATDVRLPHPTVSQVHLRLLRDRGRLLAEDAGSTNGTLLDGRPLHPGEPVEVGEGSRIRVGAFELLVGSPGQLHRVLTAAADTARFARQIVLEVMGAAPEEVHPFLEVENSPEQGQRLAIPPLSGALTVGRGEECALRLSDADASRSHLEVRHLGDAVELKDLGSKNGVEVNGTRIEGTQLAQNGDRIRVGNTLLRFGDPAEEALRSLEAAADEVEPPSEPAARSPLAESQKGAHPAPARFSGGERLLFGLAVVVVVAAVAAALYLLL
jgi:pSer/pThr/pTyr-binding forkhead associated (FHA) protein